MQGDYEIPATIGELEVIAKEFDEFYGLFALGFYIEVDRVRYAITPADAIPFAWTGGDGIHFCFLTDFGRVTDLSEAPIICSSPTNDPPLTLVAANLREFLGIVCRIKQAESLDGVRFSEPEDGWIEQISADWLDDDERLGAANLLSSVLKERLGVKEPASVYEAIRRCRAARAEMVCIDTLDRLGVLGDGEGPSPRSYDFNLEGAKDLAAMRAFVATASYVEKLAFCRDAQYTFIFAKDYDYEVQLFVAEMLDSIGLAAEAARLREM